MVNEVQSYPLDEGRAINEILSHSSYRTSNSNNNSKGNYNSKPWHQKKRQQVMAEQTTNIGRARIISHGRLKIKSHGKTIIKAKVINLATLALLCHRIKNSLFQQIVTENMFQIICTLVKAQMDKAKQSSSNAKEINERIPL